MTSVVSIFDTFQNNFGINHKFRNYLKVSCVLGFDQHFFFKYFQKMILFNKDITKIVKMFLDSTSINRLKQLSQASQFAKKEKNYKMKSNSIPSISMNYNSTCRYIIQASMPFLCISSLQTAFMAGGDIALIYL